MQPHGNEKDDKDKDDNENFRGDTEENFDITINQVPANLPNPRGKGCKPDHNLSTPTLDPYHQHLDPALKTQCLYDPQRVLRAPHPPPHGPLTLKQYELQLLIMDSTTMDLVSSTITESLNSVSQNKPSLAQKELWELLERMEKRTDNFCQKLI